MAIFYLTRLPFLCILHFCPNHLAPNNHDLKTMAPNGQNTDQEMSAMMEAKRKRRQLIRDFNIEFKGPATSKLIASLPSALKEICLDIKSLGRTNINEYCDLTDRESRGKPWRRKFAPGQSVLQREHSIVWITRAPNTPGERI